MSLTADLVAYDTVRDLADASVAAVRGVAQPGIELLGCEESETICYYFQRIDVADVLASTDGRVVVGDSLNLVSSAPNLLDPDIGRAAAEGRLFLDKFYGSFLSPGDEYVLFINHSAANFSRTTTGVPLYVQTSPGQSFKVVEGGDTIVQDSQVDWPALQRTLGELTGVQLRPPTVQSEAVELMDAPVNLNDLGLLMNG